MVRCTTRTMNLQFILYIRFMKSIFSSFTFFVVVIATIFVLLFVQFFFFKKMTAYEWRISYWSSDVCSSDLTTRSISRNGFSQVTAIFTDDTDLYFARQQVGERLLQAGENLPDGAQPQMGPVTTGLGEVVMYTVGYKNPDGKGAKKVAGQPGWQPDGSHLTHTGDNLRDEIAKAGHLRTVQARSGEHT